MSIKSNDEHIQLKLLLQQALKECARLKEENRQLKALLGLPVEHTDPPPPVQIHPLPAADETVTRHSPPEAKIALFRSGHLIE